MIIYTTLIISIE